MLKGIFPEYPAAFESQQARCHNLQAYQGFLAERSREL
jgi:hypothetical protein